MNTYLQARRMIRAAMKQIRAQTPPLLQDCNHAVTTDIRFGVLDGRPVQRLIIHLHSTGCGWARQSGGCTMCGFYAATTAGAPISSEEYQEQVFDVLSRYPADQFAVIGLYNAGNILNEDEMPLKTLETICQRIAQNPHIRRLSLEAQPKFIDEKKLRRISSILGGREIELGMGIESLNEKVKDLCINKPYPNALLKKKVQVLHNLGVIPKAYLLLKPPFLTESEAVEDYLHSYTMLNEMGVQRIDCETMTIEEYTLVHQLWQHGQYRTPWLWSIITIMDQLRNYPLYFTPFRYIVNSIAVAHNCEQCNQRVTEKIFSYQDRQITLEELLQEDCSCKQEWRAEMARVDERPIEQRIVDVLPGLQPA